MIIKKLMAPTMAIMAMFAFAEPVVSDVVAKQRYPWNGKVDITYTLTGDVAAGFAPDNQPVLQITATDNTTGETYVADMCALSGDTGLETGAHHVIWDLNAQGLEIKSDDVVFSVAYVDNPLYCIINLSAGADAESYPVSYVADVPSGGWSDEYKTTKLVLRRIEPEPIPTHDAAITKPFYIGVFEVTQKQYELVMGTNPSQYKGDMRPVEQVSYNMIRGSSKGAQWPASSEVDADSFMGRLRAKTGIEEFDLPTEAQWEYACRAGTTSEYNNGGDSVDDLKMLGRYSGNTSDGKGGYSQHTTVGSYLSNAWGLYDMHGNVLEWCLDWWNEALFVGADPAGPEKGTYRIRRGGYWIEGLCTSSERWYHYPNSQLACNGFRIAGRSLNAEGGTILCTAESVAVDLDSRIAPPVEVAVVAWDASWIGGDEDATVVIEDNGTIVTNTTGAGEFTYTLTGDGRHDLTYTTYIDGVAQDEVYKTVVYKGKYIVHFESNGGEGAMVDESFWLGIPDWLSSNVFTRVGYTFAGWATVADGEAEYGDMALVTNLTETAEETVNLYAVWVPNEYQVTFDANGGEGGWSEKMDYGTMIVAPEVSRIGYTFKGWDKDVAATVPDEDITYTAQWEVNAYAVTFDGNGGEGGTSCEQDYNSPIVAPSVSRIGYTFAGWSPEVAETVPASNVTYTAQWEINKYTVTFDAKGGEGGTSCEQDYNSPIVAPSVSRIGHTFAGWLPEVAEIVPASNVTYTAQWEVNQYSVTFDANGGVGGLSAMQNYDSEIVPPVVSRVGCTFEGWLPSPDAKVPDHNVEYVAQWKVWDITVDSVASSVKELYPDDYFRITNIVIGAEVECLPTGFFDGCDALESLAFLSSETELGDNDLRTVGRLFECQPDGYWVVQGVLFGYKGDCPREIPELDSVKRVVDCALDGCKALEELNFTAESVLTTIGTNAFKHCTELQRMTLPPSLEEIGNEAFMGCSYIGNVIVPGSVKRVGDRAFKNCTGFTAAQIAYGVESLGEEAFYGDWRISEVDIPSTVTNIGVNAFGGDSSIIRVGLRGDVRPAREIFSNYRSIREATVKEGDGEIVDGLFSGFSSLQDVHFLGNCPALANEGKLLYMNTPDKTVDYGGGNVINVLVTYVEQNSTGWDGIPGSHSLPQAWPLVGSYRRSIAWWNVPTYLCQFDANGGTLGVQDTYQYSERLITLPPEPVQTGYTFAGWWTQPIGGLRVTADTIFIEGVYTHLYAHWTKGHWVFLDPNGGTVVNDFVTYVEQSVYGVLPTPVRSGYSFGGWLYNGYKIEPETEINEKADHTLVAQWTANLYSVRYNANGGDGDMDEQGFVYGVEQELRKNLFARSGYEFIGWATNAVDAVGLEEETDAVVYADCESVSNLTAVANGWVELYAVWKESDVLPDPSNLDFHFSGDAKWELRYEGVTVEKDGETLRYATVWRSGSIAHNQKSVLVANVYGAGKVGFWWKVSCESFRDWKLDNLEFAIDGVAQEPWINGEKDWAYVEFEVETSGAHTLTWAYSKDEEGSNGEDCGWITAAVWTPKLESLGDYVNSPTLEFSSSGNMQWEGDKTISHDGIASLRSGAIGDGEVSTLETEVEGAGRIGFWWKVSSEAYRTFKIDYVSFSIDDVEQAWMGGEIGWTNVAFDVVGSGSHTLRWEYRKDDWADTSEGEDCAWLDEVVWTPSGPVIEGDADATVEGDSESGFIIKPSENNTEVVVTIPEGVVADKVTVEVAPTVDTVKPNGATIKVVNVDSDGGSHDITDYLSIPNVVEGVVNVGSATLNKEAVFSETTEGDNQKSAEAVLEAAMSDDSSAEATVESAKPGLYYSMEASNEIDFPNNAEKTKSGGATMATSSTVNIAKPEKPDGDAVFYRIKVSKTAN